MYPKDEKKQCEVFGCGRQVTGSYAIAPGTTIRLCRQCAERELILPNAANEPSDFAGTRTAQPKEQTQRKVTFGTFSTVHWALAGRARRPEDVYTTFSYTL